MGGRRRVSMKRGRVSRVRDVGFSRWWGWFSSLYGLLGEDQVWWENSSSGPIQLRAVRRPESAWDLLERRVPPW